MHQKLKTLNFNNFSSRLVAQTWKKQKDSHFWRFLINYHLGKNPSLLLSEQNNHQILLNFQYKHNLIISCSVGSEFWNSGQLTYNFTDDGPVYGPTGLLELDPEPHSSQCDGRTKPVFATCKSNCPGGELAVFSYFVTN